MAAAPPPLPDELVEEFLVRVPPDDPARLLRAALVCKRWCRLISDPQFRRRYRDHHRAPPMLGFLGIRGCRAARFFSTSSFHRPRVAWSGCLALDARHGCLLVHRWRPRIDGSAQLNRLVVWDPITNQEREVPTESLPCRPYPNPGSWSAAVICAAVDNGCDHLDCHRGPFRVIFVGTFRRQLTACVYSSEADVWAESTTMQARQKHFYCNSKVLVANALYFQYHLDSVILKYDLTTREISTIELPAQVNAHHCPTELTTVEDGRLGFAIVRKSRLSLWSMRIGPDGDARWTQIRVIQRDKLLPDIAPSPQFSLCGCADDGVIFVFTSLQIFMVNLKSGRIMKVGSGNNLDRVLPFISFCTPGAVRTVCTDEGSGVGAPSA